MQEVVSFVEETLKRHGSKAGGQELNATASQLVAEVTAEVAAEVAAEVTAEAASEAAAQSNAG